jgi:predicted TPR repeat methyltransferase
LDRERVAATEAKLDVADIGCGTGLCARFLRPLAKRLVGVDLSPGMLARARERGGYDELVEAELASWLAQQNDRFDLIVSADTLCYFGELGAALTAAREALHPDGRLVFTVEHAEGTTAGYRLGPSGRYAHTVAYVEACLADAGLAIDGIEPVVLRQEFASDVAGLLVNSRRL